jgi:hypothetical protein
LIASHFALFSSGYWVRTAETHFSGEPETVLAGGFLAGESSTARRGKSPDENKGWMTTI